MHGKSVVAKLEGCDERDAAAAMRGLEVAVPRSQLPQSQPGEYYWADLLGLAVRNLQNQPLGRVVELAGGRARTRCWWWMGTGSA